MTAEVECPVCGGGGEWVECVNDGKAGCSHTNDREHPCWACRQTGAVSETEVDREGDLITFDGCQCDMNEPCSDATCQMQRDMEQRRMFALYRVGALTPPRDVWRSLYVEQMVDAGRGHLVREDEWGPEPF